MIAAQRMSSSARVLPFTARGRLLLFIAGIGMVLWYLVVANAVVAMSYRVSEGSAQQTEILRHIEALRGNIASASSPERVEERARALGFEEVNKPVYLAIPGTSVARR